MKPLQNVCQGSLFPCPRVFHVRRHARGTLNFVSTAGQAHGTVNISSMAFDFFFFFFLRQSATPETKQTNSHCLKYAPPSASPLTHNPPGTFEWRHFKLRIRCSNSFDPVWLPPSRLSSCLLLIYFCCCPSFFFSLTKTLSVESARLFYSSFVVHLWVHFPRSFPHVSASPAIIFLLIQVELQLKTI